MFENLDPVQRFYAERGLKQLREQFEADRRRKVAECYESLTELYRRKDFEDCQFLPLEKELKK